MKSLLTIMALAIFAIMPAALAESEAMMEKPMMEEAAKVNAVVFYSDTCGACKILEPKMMEAMSVINMDLINVVKLDFSNEATIDKSKMMATENGVDSTLQSYGAKTGFVVLVNAEGQEIDKITADDSAEGIAAKLSAAALSMKIAS